MRKIILILITIYIICSCGRQKVPSPFFVWKPTDAAFDSVTQDLERAYCFNYNKDNILRLTRKLDDMAKADAKSPVKKGRPISSRRVSMTLSLPTPQRGTLMPKRNCNRLMTIIPTRRRIPTTCCA